MLKPEFARTLEYLDSLALEITHCTPVPGKRHAEVITPEMEQELYLKGMAAMLLNCTENEETKQFCTDVKK